MVRQLSADVSLDAQADAIRKGWSGQGVKLGLLLGKPAAATSATEKAPSKDVLLALLSSPPPPEDSDKSEKASRNKGATAQVNVAWQGEYARQVLTMCPGGVGVLGAFVCCSEATFKASTPALCQVLDATAAVLIEWSQAQLDLGASSSPPSSSAGEESTARLVPSQQGTLFLLHICQRPKKISAFSVPIALSGSPQPVKQQQLQPAEIKPNPQALASLLQLRAYHSVDLRIPLPARAQPMKQEAEGSLPLLRQALESAIRSTGQALVSTHLATSRDGGALSLLQDIDSLQVGSLLGPDAPPAASGARGQGSAKGKGSQKALDSTSERPSGPVQLRFLSPPWWACPMPPARGLSDGGAVAGVLRLQGSVCGVALAGPRDTLATAIHNLKADVVRSLRTRVEVFLEDAEEALEQAGLDAEEGSEGQQADRGGILGEVHQLMDAVGAGTPLSVLALPRRSLVPWRPVPAQHEASRDSKASPSLSLSDYALAHESLEECVQRVGDMLSLPGDQPLDGMPEGDSPLVLSLEGDVDEGALNVCPVWALSKDEKGVPKARAKAGTKEGKEGFKSKAESAPEASAQTQPWHFLLVVGALLAALLAALAAVVLARSK